MSSKYDKSFLEHLCDYEQAWRLLFTFSVAVIGLMSLWLFTADRESATFAVVVLNIVGASAFALLSGFLLWKCRWSKG
ncbi:hypothetical protein [Natrononativus amylolyticus]|uniref:hypothetical protein n=1 Tax=Natrononativus amylolyticus TaxID=2963434 RepID=UPI0020CD7D30|nr:hypothetical protein [Natrononativus amylolyticus]